MTRLEAADLSNYTFKCPDFRRTFAAHPDTFFVVNPEYWSVSRNRYGTPKTKPFTISDHLDLFALLRDRGNWLLHYDRVEPVLTLYAGFPMVRVKWAYGMGSNHDSNEVLILSRESG